MSKTPSLPESLHQLSLSPKKEEYSPKKDPEALKTLGDNFFRAKEYYLALESYTRALNLSPRNVELLSNRSETNINLENFKDALIDIDAIIQIQPDIIASYYRKALSLIGLRQYESALRFLESLKPKDITKEGTELKYRLTRQLNGIYDINYFLDNEDNNTMKTYPACAEYCVRVKMVEIPGKGRGLVSDVDIKAGKLIMVSKALIYSDRKAEKSEHGIFSSASGSSSLASVVTAKLQQQRDVIKQLFTLYAGPTLGYLTEEQAQIRSDLDSERIAMISQFNSFLCGPGEAFQEKPGVSSALFHQPSFLNHSCVDNNARWMTKKDFMFVRAIKDIKKGDEITISYVVPEELYPIRRMVFLSRGFECNCRLCVLEKSEPESVHTARAGIVQKVTKIPENGFLTREQIANLESCEKQLANLRPQADLNFQQHFVYCSLAAAHIRVKNNISRGIQYYEKDFELYKNYGRPHGLAAAVNCALNFAVLGKKALALRWIDKWKEQLILNVGSHNANVYGGAKEFMLENGIRF